MNLRIIFSLQWLIALGHVLCAVSAQADGLVACVADGLDHEQRVQKLLYPGAVIEADGRFQWKTYENKSAAKRSFSVAQSKLKHQRETGDFLSPQEELACSAVRDSWIKTMEYLNGGHNTLLREYIYSETQTFSPLVTTLQANIKRQRWNVEEFWWTNSDHYGKITVDTSKSLLKSFGIPNSYRVIFWPKENGVRGDFEPDLRKFRVAVNYHSNGTPHSAEIMFNDGGWKPFYLEYIDGEFIPARELEGKPVTAKCSECHKAASGFLSPKANFINTVEDYREVGITDSWLAQRLLDIGNERPVPHTGPGTRTKARPWADTDEAIKLPPPRPVIEAQNHFLPLAGKTHLTVEQITKAMGKKVDITADGRTFRAVRVDSFPYNGEQVRVIDGRANRNFPIEEVSEISILP